MSSASVEPLDVPIFEWGLPSGPFSARDSVIPVTLQVNEGDAYRSEYGDVGFLSRRGLAEVATGGRADSILARLRDLSAKYSTELTITDQRAVLEIRPSRQEEPF